MTKRTYRCPSCGKEVVLYYKALSVLCTCKTFGKRPVLVETKGSQKEEK